MLLLVDDDPAAGVLVSALVRPLSLSVVHRLDAAAAAAELRARPFALVLLDANLPGTRGTDWLAELRRREAPGARQAVALFGRPSLTDDVADAWEAGADYVVSKDLLPRPEAFRGRLGEILSHAGGLSPPRLLEYTGKEGVPPATEQRHLLGSVLSHPVFRDLGHRTTLAAVRRAKASAAGADPFADFLGLLAEQVWRLSGRDASDAVAARIRAALSRPSS